ncbi:iron uptake porin [Scytonema millei]|uniref:Iron uptake porin n=1 Tax=Scytonema millei VB511283 TaxID=1245923 RepID=A0A9X5I7U6_9CYAN|nr:iron uptake porin [Scytonema millei]NHC37727.1 iron uptake porin [Scytonema millei VB511283]
MSRLLWKAVILSPAWLTAALAVSTSAIATTPNSAPAVSELNAAIEAKETTIVNSGVTKPQGTLIAQQVPTAPAPPETDNTISEINRYGNEGRGDRNNIAQVTSVSQLSDVQPTDWAFQALQSLVERYGVIAGYPDGTFRGNRAMTRYEFAAGLNAALDRVNELIAAGTADQVRKEDLATLQRLQEEFSAELATLRGRVDSLEANVAELEANQFSTTTKLVGEVVAAVSDAFGGDTDANTVFQDRVRLDFQTSFTGSDILHTRLSAGNATRLDVGEDTYQNTLTFNPADNGNDVVVDWAAYDFKLPIGENSRAYLAAAGGVHADYAPTNNPFFEDFDGGRGAISTFASENPIYRIGGGAGLGINIAPFGEASGFKPSITAGYFARNAQDPSQGAGLFNGDYAALGQLNFNFGDRIALAATYVNAYNTGASLGNLNPDDDENSDIFNYAGSTGVVGTLEANNPSRLLGAAVGADTVPISSNSYGLSGSFRLSDTISISGFGSYTNATLIGRGNGDIWSFGGGVAFSDLGKEGNLLGIFAGVQPTLTSLDAPGVRDFSNEYGLHVEGFYRYQLTDNISVTPGVIWLNRVGQTGSDEDAIIGTLRTTFNF